jgi:hypothetical protein
MPCELVDVPIWLIGLTALSPSASSPRRSRSRRNRPDSIAWESFSKEAAAGCSHDDGGPSLAGCAPPCGTPEQERTWAAWDASRLQGGPGSAGAASARHASFSRGSSGLSSRFPRSTGGQRSGPQKEQPIDD